MPARARLALSFSGAGSVNVRLNRISSVQSIARLSGRTPFPDRRRAASTAAAALTSTFFGSHPRRAHVPPNGRLSTIATVQPAARHLDATVWAAEPEPSTTRSNIEADYRVERDATIFVMRPTLVSPVYRLPCAS